VAFARHRLPSLRRHTRERATTSVGFRIEFLASIGRLESPLAHRHSAIMLLEIVTIDTDRSESARRLSISAFALAQDASALKSHAPSRNAHVVERARVDERLLEETMRSSHAPDKPCPLNTELLNTLSTHPVDDFNLEPAPPMYSSLPRPNGIVRAPLVCDQYGKCAADQHRSHSREKDAVSLVRERSPLES